MNEENVIRVLPNDVEAEQAVLGSMIIDKEAIANVLERITPDDFYREDNKEVFSAIYDLFEASKPVDLLTLKEQLRLRGTLDAVGGIAYIAELSSKVPTSANIDHYARIVEEKSLLRKLIRAGTDVVNMSYTANEDVQTIVDTAEKKVFDVIQKRNVKGFTPIKSILVDNFEKLEELYNQKSYLTGASYGFTDLDMKTAGLHNSDLIIVAARPAMGKTTFAQNLAYNIATINRKGVLFFSMEMAANEIVDRMISDVSGVDNWKMRTGNLTDEEFQKIGDALSEMDEVPIYIDDTSSMTIMELRNKARRAMHDHDIGIVIVDYLQLISGSDRYAGNRVQEVTEISRGLKILARELEIPVIALAQLSRNVTGRDDPRPVLSDLRESGSIEQDADLVMFLHRPDYYRQNDDNYEETHITELLVAKHRHGAVGKIELYFHPELLRFMSLDTTRS